METIQRFKRVLSLYLSPGISTWILQRLFFRHAMRKISTSTLYQYSDGLRCIQLRFFPFRQFAHHQQKPQQEQNENQNSRMCSTFRSNINLCDKLWRCLCNVWFVFFYFFSEKQNMKAGIVAAWLLLSIVCSIVIADDIVRSGDTRIS